MSKLRDFRARLSRLRQLRQLVRLGMALAAFLVAVLLGLAAVFVLDWSFDMSRIQRALAIVLAAGGLVWACRRFVSPWLQVRESDVEMALLVERQQKIDCDLVAALQFENAEAHQWGSPQLRGAVIDYVADFSKGVNVLEGFSTRDLLRRAGILAVMLLAVGVVGVVHQDYLNAFLNRLCLGSAAYPTRTTLEELAINGTPVQWKPGQTVVVRSPYGVAVNLSVRASGELPEAGRVVVQPLDGRNRSTLKLARDEASSPAEYATHLPELVDALDFEVFLGDAHTDPIRVEVIPMPVIETQAQVTVPGYAQYAAPAPTGPQNSRQLSVVENSRIDLTVACTNKKLTQVAVTIDGVAYPLKPVESSARPGRLWTLAGTKSPLTAVTEPLRYEVQVVDEDGLNLPRAFQGSVRIKPDQKPAIAGGALTRFVLPTAKPSVFYRATDDYGIARLSAHLEVMRKDGGSEPRHTVPLQVLEKPLRYDHLPVKGLFPLDLPPLKLVKGDRLSVTLEVVDYRGTAAGQATLSDPIVFEITDEAGILEDIAKPDYQSAEELDAIIRQQLNIGGAR